ncbi:hypothetical protein [Amycolatopsis sp. lyj-109]|uniref:hypothetical protein n=1 Tax=Amycolatopsis sp. lyj-109 TaxID=2789287 RepID=UPI003978DDF6
MLGEPAGDDPLTSPRFSVDAAGVPPWCSPADAPELIAGRYEVAGLIGRGGTARVYQAQRPTAEEVLQLLRQPVETVPVRRRRGRVVAGSVATAATAVTLTLLAVRAEKVSEVAADHRGDRTRPEALASPRSAAARREW